MAIFTRFTSIDCPASIQAAADGFLPATVVAIGADGDIPFPQIVVRRSDGGEFALIRGQNIAANSGLYHATIPGGLLPPGDYTLQIEGCKQADPAHGGPDDWIKEFRTLTVSTAAASPTLPTSPSVAAAKPAAAVLSTGEPVLYFAIHKHMHQPYYRAAEPEFWDGGCDEIFASRAGAYRRFINMAASQYQALPEASLSMSWSGSLVEQLDMAVRRDLAHGAFQGGWKDEVVQAARLQSASGHSRAMFSAFGYYHPLMPLIPPRDIVRQITLHRDMVAREFGVAASTVLFPPETAFHVRIIPALLEAGISAVIYDSIHRYRACRDYPYAGREEGMLPPNRAEQVNPPVRNWLQLHNVWAGSKIAPSLLRPEYIVYRDTDGQEYRIIGVPAERYIGNEDARGGFGALVYPDALGQVRDSIIANGEYDPTHPPFFVLHSDGDNYGGGTDSYYGSNTGAMVEWLKQDTRFALVSVEEYLERFPPDPDNAVHIEPGSWSGADNGDPQFIKWFSGYRNDYSPDLNSWAVLTALQNAVHTVQDSRPGCRALAAAERLMLTAEASDYWYWTGQDIWDSQVTEAANAGWNLLGEALDGIRAGQADRTGPTIFPPWVTPENPGGLAWGNNGEMVAAEKTGTVHAFIHDISGVAQAALHLRTDAGNGPEQEIPMHDAGPYPNRTGAAVTAHLFLAELPRGLGDVRYYIRAEDNAGNYSVSALERIYLQPES